MPETTPTAASAHLITHNHGRTVDTHLHEPAPAPRVPITLVDQSDLGAPAERPFPYRLLAAICFIAAGLLISYAL